jgi:hypothetical protein
MFCYFISKTKIVNAYESCEMKLEIKRMTDKLRKVDVKKNETEPMKFPAKHMSHTFFELIAFNEMCDFLRCINKIQLCDVMKRN